MRISELIAKLEEIRQQHGDLPVLVSGTIWDGPYIWEDGERQPELEAWNNKLLICMGDV